MDFFETEAFRTYDEKFKAMVMATAADDIARLESEVALLKLALIKAEAERNGYAD